MARKEDLSTQASNDIHLKYFVQDSSLVCKWLQKTLYRAELHLEQIGMQAGDRRGGGGGCFPLWSPFIGFLGYKGMDIQAVLVLYDLQPLTKI